MTWFDPVLDGLQRWRAMRELKTIQRREESDYRWDFKGLMIEAHDTLDRGNRPRTREIWERAQAMFPDLAMNSEQALALLLRLNLFDEAEALLNRGLKKYQGSGHFLEGLAQVAYRRGDKEETLRRCEILRKKHPSSLKGYGIAAAALSELKRPDEAEAMISQGLVVRKDDVGLRIEYARLAERRQDWEEAIKRWTDVHETYGHGAGTVGVASVLTRLGRYDEADKVLTSVLYKSANEINIWIEYAAVAEKRQDWEQVAQRWASVRARFPLEPIGYIRGLDCLARLGREDEAEAILLEGIERVTDDAALSIEYARLAQRRKDWPEAASRWAMAREHFPECKPAYDEGAYALEALGRNSEAAQLRQLARIG